MHCLIRLPTSTRWHTPRGKYGRRYAIESFQMTIDYSARVFRLALPKQQNEDQPFVIVDAWIPEDKRSGIAILDSRWVEPGVFRTAALIKKNRTTLAPFLESGLNEMDVRGED